MKATNRQNVILRRKSNGKFKKIRLQRRPTQRIEKDYLLNGYTAIAGVDEVGIGSWAGPVVAAAVILKPSKRLYKIRDSKILDQKRREELFTHIIEECVCYGIGEVNIEEVNNIGLSASIKLAGERALRGLDATPQIILLDGHWNYLTNISEELNAQVRTIVHGDTISLTISAASIIAKVTRDNLMIKLSKDFPEYDFLNNKGYPSPKHKQALADIGPCTLHRVSYAPIRKLLGVRE